MPSRMLHEAICTSLKLSRISFEAEVLYYRLQVNADDFGRFYATESIVRNACFTAGKSKPPNVEKCLKELHEAGLIRLYEHDEERYLAIEKWEEKQRQRASKSKFPSPPALADKCGQLTANAPVIVNVNVDESVNDPPVSPQGEVDFGEEEDQTKIRNDLMLEIDAHTDNPALKAIIMDWMEMRAAKGKRFAVNTVQALRLNLNKANTYSSEAVQIKAFEHAIANSHQSLFYDEAKNRPAQGVSLYEQL